MEGSIRGLGPLLEMELGHICSRDSTLAERCLSSYSSVSRISQWGPGLGFGNVQEFDFQRLEGQMTNLEWEGRQPGVTAVTAPTLG